MSEPDIFLINRDSTLKMRSLGVSRKILAASPGVAAMAGKDLAGLPHLSTLSTNEDAGEAEWLLIGPGGLAKKIRHDPRVRCGDFAAIRGAAADGAGVAFPPDHTCRDYLAAGKLMQVFPKWHSPDGFVHMVFTAHKGLPASVRAVIDHLVSAFPPGTLSSRDFELRHMLSQGEAGNDRVAAAAS